MYFFDIVTIIFFSFSLYFKQRAWLQPSHGKPFKALQRPHHRRSHQHRRGNVGACQAHANQRRHTEEASLHLFGPLHDETNVSSPTGTRRVRRLHEAGQFVRRRRKRHSRKLWELDSSARTGLNNFKHNRGRYRRQRRE